MIWGRNWNARRAAGFCVNRKARHGIIGEITMRLISLAAAAAFVAFVPGFSAHASPVAMDQPIAIDGIETVCTGIGDEAQHDPRWAAYPVRVEFADKAMHYLSGAHVELRDAGGKTLASLDCAGAWVLFKLAPAKYVVEASLLWEKADTASAPFDAPATGQKRVVLRFNVSG